MKKIIRNFVLSLIETGFFIGISISLFVCVSLLEGGTGYGFLIDVEVLYIYGLSFFIVLPFRKILKGN